MSDAVAEPREASLSYAWDFFLAHAGADLPIAQDLYGRLSPAAKVFLDAITMLPGDDWDQELRTAQRASLISVIILSSNTNDAYYQREEIAAAIDMARQDKRSHRVVPLYVNAKEIPHDDIPYGLRLKHSLYVPGSGDLTSAGTQLLHTLEMMKHYEDKKTQVVATQRIAIEKIVSNRSNTEVLSGFHAVTTFVRPMLHAFIIMLVLTIVLLGLSMFAPAEFRGLMVAVSASLAALFLAATLSLIAYSLRYAPQIAHGQINGG
jgi:TIR domain-containing protein